jgi:hypothetical protein
MTRNIAGSSKAASPKLICLIQSDRGETGKPWLVSILANICAIDPRGSPTPIEGKGECYEGYLCVFGGCYELGRRFVDHAGAR